MILVIIFLCLNMPKFISYKLKVWKYCQLKKKKSTHVEWLNENAGVIELFVIIDHDLR